MEVKYKQNIFRAVFGNPGLGGHDTMSGRLVRILFCAVLAFMLMLKMAIYVNQVRRENEGIQRAIAIFKKQARDLGFQPEDLSVLRTMVQKFDQIARKHNISYVLFGGTLIGAYRNRSLIPWDDDFDLSMRADHVKVVEKEFQNTSYSTTMHTKNIFKIFPKVTHSKINNHRKWNWPFIDIFLQFSKDPRPASASTRVSSSSRSTANKSTTTSAAASKKKNASADVVLIYNVPYLLSDLRPSPRPVRLLDLDLPVPSNTSKTLVMLYGNNTDILTKCSTNYYDHRRERFTKKTDLVTIDCKHLRKEFNLAEKPALD